VISPTTFRDIVSGRRRGLATGLLRAGLWTASIPYSWAVTLRNRRYDRGAAEVFRPAVPVVSVGNLTVGGTGKTPMVEWLVRRLHAQGLRPAILSRGYRAIQGAANDEALELELALGRVPHLQNPDRVASAAQAVADFGAQALVLDDGFQHRRLARDLDIVLLDASEPFGFEHLLPRGTLREPVAGLRRAHIVVLSRADMLDPAGRDAVRRRAEELCPRGAWCEVEHRPAALLAPGGAHQPLDDARHARVAAFCGIGNPAGFRHTLDALGCHLQAWREFPDHHAYTRADIAELDQWARQAQASLVLCTRKDLVKIQAPELGAAPLRAVGVELRVLRGEEAIEAALATLFTRQPKPL
jgi:tetraacyldisaccharide 4'-kinase